MCGGEGYKIGVCYLLMPKDAFIRDATIINVIEPKFMIGKVANGSNDLFGLGHGRLHGPALMKAYQGTLRDRAGGEALCG